MNFTQTGPPQHRGCRDTPPSKREDTLYEGLVINLVDLKKVHNEEETENVVKHKKFYVFDERQKNNNNRWL